ncbi:MAG: hypothetical protein HFH32_09510 [Eubacterium sp.]|jgi:hypothetical protein|nr:hypothetical protein [Eubacterium sp.]
MRAERDIALCAVADAGVRSKVMNAMIQKSLPYAEEWHKVPLLRRRKYEGAKEVCVIITHREHVEEAKKLVASQGDATSSRVYFDLDGLLR